jgi:hypothetical protein
MREETPRSRLPEPYRAGLVALLLVVSCTGGGGGSDGTGSSSCDDAANHLIALCAPLTGEDFRAQCEVPNQELITAQQRSCAARMRTCDASSIKACDLTHIVLGCSSDGDCPSPFVCDVGRENCVRCLSDEHCAPGRGCLEGLCYDKSSAFYRTFKQFLGSDAGLSHD